MNKALGILKEIEAQKHFIYGYTKVWCRAIVVNESNKIKEAIKELEEAMKPKSCDGCVYAQVKYYTKNTVWLKDTASERCKCCSRTHDDNYKPKEQWWIKENWYG